MGPLYNGNAKKHRTGPDHTRLSRLLETRAFLNPEWVVEAPLMISCLIYVDFTEQCVASNQLATCLGCALLSPNSS